VLPRLLALLLALATSLRAATADSELKIYRDSAARREGNAARGREIFLRAEKSGCALCHSVDGSSGKAGPDLASVGDVLGRVELVEAILQPNASIAVGYDATLVEKHSGEVVLGVVKSANAAALELVGVDGVRVVVSRGEVKSTKPGERSLMPEGIHAALTPQEFVDLIEYLASLKQSDSTRALHRGAPEMIPLAKPISLQPLLTPETRFPSSVVRKPGDVRLGLVWCGAIPGTDALLAAHQSGALTRLELIDGRWMKTPFGNIGPEIYSRTGPNGLLGVAFHPTFGVNRKYYLKHQVFEAGQIVTTVVERIATPDGRADSGRASRRLLAIPCVTQNHTGGCIEFGPDGYLYIGMGDTGPQRDPNGHGQDRQLFLGKLLRIDVNQHDAARPFGIPADNPFVGRTDTRPEIWAIGFREPWRFSFDAKTGDLWVGDVGQDRVEEVAIVRRGENHGWNVYEGFEPFSGARRTAEATYVPPVFAYKRKYGNSVTGGFVYRGDERSSFHGVYIFGDYTSKKIFGLWQEDRQLVAVREIGQSPESIASFGTDAKGNIYLVSYEGMIYHLDFTVTEFDRAPTFTPASAPAARLSGS
jgi:putative heme-binding domain-containing protein